MINFFLSEAGNCILIAFAIAYDMINKIIIIPNPKNGLDASSIEYPSSADSDPASIPIPTRSQKSLSSGFFRFTPSVGFDTGTSGEVSFVFGLFGVGFSFSFFGCLVN